MKITKRQLRQIIREEVNRSTHKRLSESKKLVRLTHDPDELGVTKSILRSQGVGHVIPSIHFRHGYYWATAASRLEARDVVDALLGYLVGDEEMLEYVVDPDDLD